MELDFIDVTLIIFLTMMLGVIIGFTIHAYRDLKDDERLFGDRPKIKIEKP